MLKEHRPGEYVAVCDACEEASAPFTGSREVALLRLMRSGWRLRTHDRTTQTWCPCCLTMPPIPSMKIAEKISG